MLRRADNCNLVYVKRVFGMGRLQLHVGKSVYLIGKYDEAEVTARREQQMHAPIGLRKIGERTYWRFKDRYYWDNDGHTADEVYALLVTRMQREQATVERARAIVAMGKLPRSTSREAIPEDVRQLVFVRDGGRCCSCGSTTNLEFDHVIPVSMGGSSGPKNLQVLCGPCNRAKGAGIVARPSVAKTPVPTRAVPPR